jgi:hypothetical protein
MFKAHQCNLKTLGTDKRVISLDFPTDSCSENNYFWSLPDRFRTDYHPHLLATSKMIISATMSEQ